MIAIKITLNRKEIEALVLSNFMSNHDLRACDVEVESVWTPEHVLETTLDMSISLLREGKFSIK